MSNANTIDRVVGAGSPAQGVKAAPSITLVTTTEKLVLDQTGATATVYAQPQAAPSASGPFDTMAFKVRATFRTTTGGTSTSVVNIYLGTTIVAGNKLGSVTSQSLATASASGFLELYLVWDNTSQVLSGLQCGQYGTGTAVIYAALSNTAVAATSISALKFCISATNGSSVTGTTFQLGEFVVEEV
jgi:hypothetical protein